MIKLDKDYPEKLGIRLCNVHKKSVSLIVIVTADNKLDKTKSTFREFFCIDCKLVLGADDTYTEFFGVMNERINEAIA